MDKQRAPCRDFVIPRKTAVHSDSKTPKIVTLPLNSDRFRNTFSSLIPSLISNHCPDRNLVRVIKCREIINKALEAKFLKLQSKLQSENVSYDVSYGFLLVTEREADLYAVHGLCVGNDFIGDLGDSNKGVYLHETPDLVTPAYLMESVIYRILMCKVLKGKVKHVPLGSFASTPTVGYHCHMPIPPQDGRMNRVEAHRYSQIYLYQQEGVKFSKIPANVLPYAIYELEFPRRIPYRPNLNIVWEGGLKIGDTCCENVSLRSNLFLKPPFLEETLNVLEIIPWAICISFDCISELLKPQIVGDIARKEVFLPNSRRFASYFMLETKDDGISFKCLHESIRAHRAVGVAILSGGGTIILVPNGQFSSLLCLPFKENIFHCLYLSKDDKSSLHSGIFEPLSQSEEEEFSSLPVLSEKINGAEEILQSFARNISTILHSPNAVMPNLWTLPKDAEEVPEEANNLSSSSKEDNTRSSTSQPFNPEKNCSSISSSRIPLNTNISSSTTIYKDVRDPRKRKQLGLPLTASHPSSHNPMSAGTSSVKSETVEKAKDTCLLKPSSDPPMKKVKDVSVTTEYPSLNKVKCEPSSNENPCSSSNSLNTGMDNVSLVNNSGGTTSSGKASSDYSSGGLITFNNAPASPSPPPQSASVANDPPPKTISDQDLRNFGPPFQQGNYSYKPMEFQFPKLDPSSSMLKNFHLSSEGLEKINSLAAAIPSLSFLNRSELSSSDEKIESESSQILSPSDSNEDDKNIVEDREDDCNFGRLVLDFDAVGDSSSLKDTICTLMEDKMKTTHQETEIPLARISPTVSRSDEVSHEKTGPSSLSSRIKRWDVIPPTLSKSDVDMRKNMLPPGIAHIQSVDDFSSNVASNSSPAVSVGDIDLRFSTSTVQVPFISLYNGPFKEAPMSVPPAKLTSETGIPSDANVESRLQFLPSTSLYSSITTRSSVALQPNLHHRPRRPLLETRFAKSAFPRPSTSNLQFFPTAPTTRPSYQKLQVAGVSNVKSLSFRGFLIPDDLLFTSAKIPALMLRSVLSAFEKWNASGSKFWTMKISTNLMEIIHAKSNEGDTDAEKQWGQYKQILNEFEARKVVEYMKIKDSSLMSDDFLGWLTNLSQTNHNHAIIYLTEETIIAEFRRSLESIGVEINTLEQIFCKLIS